MENPELFTDTPALEISNLNFRYLRREDYALHSLSFNVQPGEVLLIAGASGCGKTTLMRCINGLIPRTYHGDLSGEIRIFGKSIAEIACFMRPCD